MENASNALIIAGTVLIALIIISLGVYLAVSNSRIQQAYIENLTTQEIEKFNNKFLVFNNRDNITAQEIVTLIEFTKQFDEKHGTTTEIQLPTGSSTDTIQFIQNSQPVLDSTKTKMKYTYYKCNKGTLSDIVYNSQGRVITIKFQKNEKLVDI